MTSALMLFLTVRFSEWTKTVCGWALHSPRPLADFKGRATGKGNKGREKKKGGWREEKHPQFLKCGCAPEPYVCLCCVHALINWLSDWLSICCGSKWCGLTAVYSKNRQPIKRFKGRAWDILPAEFWIRCIFHAIAWYRSVRRARLQLHEWCRRSASRWRRANVVVRDVSVQRT